METLLVALVGLAAAVLVARHQEHRDRRRRPQPQRQPQRRYSIAVFEPSSPRTTGRTGIVPRHAAATCTRQPNAVHTPRRSPGVTHAA
jgi:hypothetical protein